MKNIASHFGNPAVDAGLPLWYSYIEDPYETGVENSPQRLPMRYSIGVDDQACRTGEYFRSRPKGAKFWSKCKAVDGLVEASIGKPFSEVYSKVCKQYGGDICQRYSVKEHFKDKFRKRFWNLSPEYTIDEEGLIQKVKEEPKRVKRKPRVYTRPKSEWYKVEKDEIQNCQDLLSKIYYQFGAAIYWKILESEEISEELYLKLGRKLGFDEIRRLIGRYVTQYYWEKGTSGYKQVRAEQEDATRKKEREERAKREFYRENLLHYLAQEQKRKEAIQNEVTRDRLGFDDESFKGEFYHGQKRKKVE
jgi:hypothetical protein